MVEYEYLLQLGAQKFNKEAYAVFHVSASFRVCITSQNFGYCLPYAQAKQSKIDDMWGWDFSFLVIKMLGVRQ
jgi:hypothetical protein